MYQTELTTPWSIEEAVLALETSEIGSDLRG